MYLYMCVCILCMYFYACDYLSTEYLPKCIDAQTAKLFLFVNPVGPVILMRRLIDPRIQIDCHIQIYTRSYQYACACMCGR